MGNAPSNEEAAVGLAPGTEIRPTGEPASVEGQIHGNNEIVTTSSSGCAGANEPAEGENVTQ